MSWTKGDEDALLDIWQRERPDPVDEFEDRLAAQHGLWRHPALCLDEWRRLRVRYLDTLEANDGRS